MTTRTANNIVLALLVLLLAFDATAIEHKAKVTGIFSDMHFVAEAGDVLGVEVLISYSARGESSSYWAYVQIAEGVPFEPVLVKASVKGDQVEFAVPKDMGGQFVGRVTEKGLEGQFLGSGLKVTLSRRSSYWQ